MSASLLCAMVFFIAVPIEADADVDFARDIQPILSDKCFTCHGPDEAARQADLRLDTEPGLIGSGVVTAGDSAESEIIRRVTTDDTEERMPPLDSNLELSQNEIAILRKWIDGGAKWSRHWAYESIHRPSVPNVTFDADRVNPIDSFVQARLATPAIASLHPAPQSSPERLIRRVTLDLTGLPPSPEVLDDFEISRPDDAYNRIVDNLLASPAFGERMAWPWLDAARYADSNGFQGDRERTMWPWRDWAIDAINRNLPYDKFTVWQIAGDELPDATEEQKIATGFCRNHMINGEGGRIAAENRVEYIFDQVETVGTIWLGMTVQCCRCHDHKFDPITQDEYFKFFAFFNQTPVNGGGGDPQTPPVLAAADRLQKRTLKSLGAQIHEASKALRQLEKSNADIAKNKPITEEEKQALQGILKKSPQERSIDDLKRLEKLAGDVSDEYKTALESLRLAIEKREAITKSLPKVMVMENLAHSKFRKTNVLDRGLYNKPLHAVTAGVPATLPRLRRTPLANGNEPTRLDLATWLVDERNPLTARVTVNRIWQTFFGRGLVETTGDFGIQSKRPSHPLLLDWLASELIRSDWDVKHIIRLIVTSATYRQSAKNTESISVDPANRRLARGPRFRMPAWMLRDQALAISGLLVQRQGGPPVQPYQPKGVWADATFGKKQYRTGSGADLYRRSIYIFWRRIIGPTVFFDGGKRQTCEVKISRTNTPLHALATLNDVTYVEAARAMAEKVYRRHSEPASRIDYAFRLATARRPSQNERLRLANRLAELRAYYRDHKQQADELLSVGKSPRDESIETAEHAAFSCICLMILNLDETLTN